MGVGARTLTLGHAIMTTPRDVREALLQGKLAGTAAEQQLQQLGEGYADEQIELGIGYSVLDTLDKEGRSIPVPGGDYLSKLVSHDVFSIGGGGGVNGVTEPGGRHEGGTASSEVATATMAPRGCFTMDRIITPAVRSPLVPLCRIHKCVWTAM